MTKTYIRNFEIWKSSRNATCDFWKASGFVKNNFYIVESGFLYTPKKEIEKILKNKIREKAI